MMVVVMMMMMMMMMVFRRRMLTKFSDDNGDEGFKMQLLTKMIVIYNDQSQVNASFIVVE